MSQAAQKERRREQRAHTRREILDATEALLVEDGAERFSIRRLVDRCGYAAPTIYHHFGDKDGLLDALLEERFELLARRLRKVPRGGDAAAYLRAVALGFVKFGLQNPTHYQLLSVPRSPEHAPPASAEEARAHLDRAWRELWDAGRLRTSDLDGAGQALWALCHGLIAGRIHRPDNPWSKTLVEDSIDALLRGLIAPESASRSAKRSAPPVPSSQAGGDSGRRAKEAVQ